MNWAPKSQLRTWEVAHAVDGVREIEGEGFLRIRVQGQNGLYYTKLGVFFSVLQILECLKNYLEV